MVFHKARNFALSIAATALVLVSAGAYADDTEIFLGNPSNLAAPNIMLILDTSGSMASNTISPVPYDPEPHLCRHGDCSNIANRVYWSTNNSVPDCDSGNWFDMSSAEVRDRAVAPLRSAPAVTARTSVGSFAGAATPTTAAGRRSATTTTRETSSARPTTETTAIFRATDPYPRNITQQQQCQRRVDRHRRPVGLAEHERRHARHPLLRKLHHLLGAVPHPGVMTRMDVMKDAATRLLSALSRRQRRLDALQPQSREATAILRPRAAWSRTRSRRSIATGSELIEAVNSWNAGGFTPLSETLFESYRYFSGGAVGFGNTSVPFLSVAESRNPAGGRRRELRKPGRFLVPEELHRLSDGRSADLGRPIERRHPGARGFRHAGWDLQRRRHRSGPGLAELRPVPGAAGRLHVQRRPSRRRREQAERHQLLDRLRLGRRRRRRARLPEPDGPGR